MQRDISEALLLLRLQKQLGILLLSLSSNVEVISSVLETGRIFSRDDPELSGGEPSRHRIDILRCCVGVASTFSPAIPGSWADTGEGSALVSATLKFLMGADYFLQIYL